MSTTQILLLVFGCLGSIGAMLGAVENWAAIYAPAFVGGVLVNIASHVAAAVSPTNGGGGGGLGTVGRNSLKGFVAFALLILLVACTAGQIKIALQAEHQIHAGLGRARQTIVATCPETNLSQGCSTIKSAFNDLLDAAASYNRGLANKDLSQGPALLKAIDAFVAKIKTIDLPSVQSIVGDVAFARGGVK